MPHSKPAHMHVKMRLNRQTDTLTIGAVAWLMLGMLSLIAACSASTEDERTVRVGFYAFFEPISAAADPDTDAAAFSTHVGYEADLLTAMESMEGLSLRFHRTPVAEWPGIWLLPSREGFDMVSGGITILDSRRLDADGNTVITFSEPHIEFRQSLLVRADDADRLPNHDALLSTDVVGALPATTGEARLLQLIGIADAQGRLAAGTQVHTPTGVVTVPSDGALSISAAQASPELEHRTRLVPADPTRPTVVYLGEESGEVALLAALRDGRIDAVARGTIGNTQAAVDSDGRFAVTAPDEHVELGGFAVSVDDTELLDKLNSAVTWLTDAGRIGIREWLADGEIFNERARSWQPSR
ncbi:MAG: transporter substrate-binding domain-containing protein [Acidimicrobiales bacterium]|nr:transporter substrate-binding domain-containing protein [Acidimicrobiales bacterium]MYG89823.1 transporter substrate-binding domain-containing protein [Acidimicrobiales bacterium]MYI29499.1 transporter substrate-binding domain-containing protein [Acidimicrobiales bacterium]